MSFTKNLRNHNPLEKNLKRKGYVSTDVEAEQRSKISKAPFTHFSSVLNSPHLLELAVGYRLENNSLVFSFEQNKNTSAFSCRSGSEVLNSSVSLASPAVKKQILGLE